MPLMVTDTGFAGNLKNYYTRFREDLFPVLDRLFAQFQKIKSGGPRNMRWQGNGAYFDAVVGDPVGWHYSSAGWLPDSAFRSEVQGVVGIARLYVRQEIDGLTVPATSSKQGAYVTIAQKIDEEMRMKFRLGPVNSTQTKMEFANNSYLESLPSASDPARGESAYLIVVDELAFLQNSDVSVYGASKRAEAYRCEDPR